MGKPKHLSAHYATWRNGFLTRHIVAAGGSGADDGSSFSGRADSSASIVWGAVVSFERVGKKDNTDGGDGESHKKRKEGPYIVDVLVNCASDSIPGTGPKR